MSIRRVFTAQIVGFTVAGISQLFALSYATNQLSDLDSARFMYLVSLASLFSFLDFGILWSLFMNLSKGTSSYSQLLITAYIKVTRVSLAIGLILILLLLLSFVSFDVVLVISAVLVNNFFFVGLVGLRAIRGEVLYFAVFNASWPLTYLSFQFMALAGVTFKPIIAVVPIVASAVLSASVSAYISINYISKKSSNTFSELNQNELRLAFRRTSFYSTFLQLLSLVMLYGDRFFIFPKLSKDDFVVYAVSVQFATMAIVLIQNFSSSLIGTSYSQVNRLRKTIANGLPVIPLLGMLAGLIYFALMPVVANQFFPALSISTSLVFTISIHIFLSSVSIQIYQNLWINDGLKLRVFIQLTGIISYIIYGALILNDQVTLWQASSSLMFSHLGIFVYYLQSLRARNGLK